MLAVDTKTPRSARLVLPGGMRLGTGCLYDARVDHSFPIRLGIYSATAFSVGLVGGFLWSLLQRRPATSYPDLLAADRAAAQDQAE